MGDMRSAALLAAFLAGFIVALGMSGRAQDWIVTSGVAKHLDGGTHCNSLTTGLGAEYLQSANVRGTAGFYRNSNCKWSVYAGQAYMPIHLGFLHAGAIAGAATGYGRPITPAGGLAVALEGSRYGLNAIYIPPLRGSGNVLWLSAKVRF